MMCLMSWVYMAGFLTLLCEYLYAGKTEPLANILCIGCDLFPFELVLLTTCLITELYLKHTGVEYFGVHDAFKGYQYLSSCSKNMMEL